MQFCKNGANFTNIWYSDGFNPCFLDTVTSGILFLTSLLLTFIQSCVLSRHSNANGKKKAKSNCGYVLQIIMTIILMIEAVAHFITLDMARENSDPTGSELLTFLFLFCAWGVTLLLLRLRRRNVSSGKSSYQTFLLPVIWTLAFILENLAFISWRNDEWWWSLSSSEDKIEFGFWVWRYVVTTTLLVICISNPGLGTTVDKSLEDGYGKNTEEKKAAKAEKDSTWTDVLRKLKMMAPYVWPKGSLWRQAIVLLSLVLLGVLRGINVLVPLYNKYIVDSLTIQPSENEQGETIYTTPEFRWDYICIYVFLLFLRGGGTGGTGFLHNARLFLWVYVQQYTARRIQTRLFGHLHSLSLRWHVGRKTGEVLRVVDRGTNSINNVLNYVLFEILPTFVDIIIAIVFFVTAFSYVFGVVISIAMAMYLGVTIYITEWRTKFRRTMNKLDNATNAQAVDSLLNYETVKYYSASKFEIERYEEAILKFQRAEWKNTATLNLLNTAQNIVISLGILAGSLLCALAVVYSLNGLQLTAGDYVLFGTYIVQLYGPLNWLGTYYRLIQQAFIDMENMFELLNTKPEVTDVSDARDLVINTGTIEFKDVKFRYEPSKPFLKDINFTVPPGQTYALVGHSGSGKTTLIRLLFRFYDLKSGKITVDGQDISQVTQESLRKCIGVVPQDTVLFNSDIKYNIRFGRVTASDQEVEDAAKTADIHARILTFPDQYETVVGERGLKLSGGEKQRVAIARTVLKNPAIVLLDEATSALDTETERNIQSALAKVCENRTTIIVAHRLSTVIHADMILVMKEGEIVERGKHLELLAQDGHYSDMWQHQLSTPGGEQGEISEENVAKTEIYKHKL